MDKLKNKINETLKYVTDTLNTKYDSKSEAMNYRNSLIILEMKLKNLSKNIKELMDNKITLTWKEVFNSQMMWPMDYYQCREWAEKIGYKYLAFNGDVFHVDDIEMKNVICSDDKLES